jgi:5'-nucleotidase
VKILLTNDDGYAAKGINTLAEVFAADGHSVTIVAPESQQSAASHAVTLHKPLRLKRAEELEKKNIRVYHTNGTPTDSAMLGLLEAAPESDLLISGINRGPNLGEDVLYSGTVAAAMEGALLGRRSIAVSLAHNDANEYELAALFTLGLAKQFAASGLPEKTVLNVNIPPVPVSEYKGFRVVRLGSRKYVDILQKRVDPRGETYFWVTGEVIRDQSGDDTDSATISRGLVSITPLTLDLTDKALIPLCAFCDPMKK